MPADHIPALAPSLETGITEVAPLQTLGGGVPQWVTTTETGSGATVRLVRGDAAGNSYTALTFEEGTRFSGVLLPGPRGMALVSHSPSGQVRWARTFHCTNAEPSLQPRDLWVTPGGRSVLVVAGLCTVDFGGGMLSGRNLMVALGPEGQHLWSRALVPVESSKHFPFPAVAVSPLTNEVYVAGTLDGPVTVEGNVHAPTSGTRGLLLRYGSRGGFLGAREVRPYTGDLRVHDIAFDEVGRLLAVFTFTGTVDLGDGIQIAAGPSPVLVARYTAGGQLLWDHQIGGHFEPSAIAAQGGRVFVAGDFLDSILFLGQTYTAPASRIGLRSTQGFVYALSRSSGQQRWMQVRGRQINDMAADVGGGVTVKGWLSDLPPPEVTSTRAMFVAKYDSLDGHARWLRPFEFGGVLQSLGVTAGGDPLVAGTFTGTIDLGTGPITAVPAASPQSFLMRLTP